MEKEKIKAFFSDGYGLMITEEQLAQIMKRYEERLFAGGSGQQAAKKEEEPQEEKRWGWDYTGPVWEVREEPKRKLTFREWLDGGMKGECQWANRSKP